MSLLREIRFNIIYVLMLVDESILFDIYESMKIMPDNW
jgi:hypothetical protein